MAICVVVAPEHANGHELPCAGLVWCAARYRVSLFGKVQIDEHASKGVARLRRDDDIVRRDIAVENSALAIQRLVRAYGIPKGFEKFFDAAKIAERTSIGGDDDADRMRSS